MSAFVLSLYIGYALYGAFPYMNVLLGSNPAATRALLSILAYAVFVGISFYLLRKMGYGSRTRKPLHMIVLDVLSLGFLANLAYQSFAITKFVSIPPSIGLFFVSTYFYCWFIAPLIGLFLLNL